MTTDGLSLREFLTFRLDKQDEKLEDMGAEIKEVAKNSNGRLRDLETERHVLLAVNERSKDQAERRWKWAYITAAIIGGGLGGGIGHALGWW